MSGLLPVIRRLVDTALLIDAGDDADYGPNASNAASHVLGDGLGEDVNSAIVAVMSTAIAQAQLTGGSVLDASIAGAARLVGVVAHDHTAAAAGVMTVLARMVGREHDVATSDVLRAVLLEASDA